jgi:hypothetical protein
MQKRKRAFMVGTGRGGKTQHGPMMHPKQLVSSTFSGKSQAALLDDRVLEQVPDSSRRTPCRECWRILHTSLFSVTGSAQPKKMRRRLCHVSRCWLVPVQPDGRTINNAGSPVLNLTP